MFLQPFWVDRLPAAVRFEIFKRIVQLCGNLIAICLVPVHLIHEISILALHVTLHRLLKLNHALCFDIIKVASCSAKDWPLLEAIADSGKPVICSTGGLSTEDIDNVVSFFQHRAVHFALMHCVSIYPTPDEKLCLRQIRALCERYPDTVIGWSTHESPEDNVPVGMALALGARMFERHVGVATDQIQLNAYSSTPEQLSDWLAAHARARVMLGPVERPPASAAEQDAIDSLRRGVYARRPIRKGAVIASDQVFFAMPYNEGQLESGRWKDGIVAFWFVVRFWIAD